MKAKAPPPECLQTWHVERHNDPWSGLMGGAAAEEATYTVPRLSERTKAPNIIAQPALVSAGDFVLYRSQKGRAVFVNPVYFSELTRVDVTGRALRNEGKIGSATAKALQRWSPMEILSLLIDLQIIITYAHVEAKICLVRAEKKGDIFWAELKGEHVYYTNRRNVSHYTFSFALNEKTGAMQVFGQ